jgi:DNA-binding GntR family transcriptional regulator
MVAQPDGAAPGSKAAEAYRALKDMIVALELAPGARLDERGLADRLGVGLTPVRQALRRLEWEGLVAILPRRGTRVAPLDEADLERIYGMRSLLEPLAARRAAACADTGLRADLEDVARRTREALADPVADGPALIRLDRELHRLLWAMADDAMLERTLEWLYSHVVRRWYAAIDRVDGLTVAIADHLPIADAVLAGDADAAERGMAAHVARFQRSMERT